MEEFQEDPFTITPWYIGIIIKTKLIRVRKIWNKFLNNN